MDTLRRARRSARVAWTGLRIYAGYKRTQRRVRGMDADRATAAWEAQHERAAEALYRTATALRGLYIKSGQFAGTRSDLFPAPYIRWLSRLQDRVPPHPVDVIRATIEEDLHRPIREMFESFEDRPLAAASLAQVHRAWLPDGTAVAVKVQYPEVADLVRLDVRNLRTLTRLVARLEPNFDFRAIVDEIAVQVPLELDFQREAALTRRLRSDMAGYGDLVVPDVVGHISSRRVLVTEFLVGERLFEHGKPHALAAGEAERVVKLLGAVYGHQILGLGVFHADPHPGNILLLPDGRVGLLDFGLTKELPDRVRLGFARLVLAAADRDPSALRDALDEIGVRARAATPADLLPLVGLFFDRREEPGGSATFTATRRATLRATPVEAIPGDLVLLGRVVGLLRGVAASLGVALSPMEMLRPYAEEALAAPPGS